MERPLIYLDHNATTPVAEGVLEAMLPWFREHYGNAGSAHPLGLRSEAAVARAREQLAELLGASPAELVFTSGGTESLNQAFRGVFEALPAKRHVVISAVEHPAVLALAAWLKHQGAAVTEVGVDGQGRLDLEALEAAIRPDTGLVSVMAANNESGVCFPLAAVAERVKAKGCLLHVDATQAVGKVPLDLATLPIDLLSLSGHKFHGPKGTGATFLRRGVRLKPFMVGGHQERGRRGGTENVPGLVGLGAAADLARQRLGGMARVRALRDRLEARLQTALPDLVVHGAQAERLPNTSFFAVPGVEGEALLLRLGQEGFCVSVGSACTTGRREPSHVLTAMGVAPDLARSTLRVSLGHPTTDGEVEAFCEVLPCLVVELRSEGPLARPKGRP